MEKGFCSNDMRMFASVTKLDYYKESINNMGREGLLSYLETVLSLSFLSKVESQCDDGVVIMHIS